MATFCAILNAENGNSFGLTLCRFVTGRIFGRRNNGRSETLTMKIEPLPAPVSAGEAKESEAV